jgi:hypothetical protein
MEERRRVFLLFAFLFHLGLGCGLPILVRETMEGGFSKEKKSRIEMTTSPLSFDKSASTLSQQYP